MEDRDVPFENPEAQLRSGQVAEDPDLTPDLRTGLPDAPHRLGVLAGGSVGEVQPEDVDAGVEQLAKDLGLTARGTDRRHDLGSARASLARAGHYDEPPVARVWGTGGTVESLASVTGPVGASSGRGGPSSSCSITGSRQTTLASTSPAAAESSARKSWPPPIRVRSKKWRATGTASTRA